MDLGGVIDTASPDIIYHNIPMPAAHGRDSFKAAIEPMFSMSREITWEASIIAEAAQGEILTERIDAFRLESGKQVAVRVMGVFEWAENGELLRWRDYFDLAEFEMQIS